MINKQKLKERIEGFKQLEENWDSYGARKIEELSIKKANEFVDSLDEESESQIYVYPSAEGGILFENDYLSIAIKDGKIIDIYLGLCL